MSEYLIQWSGQFFISGLDFVIVYMVSHALVKKYIIVEKKHVLYGIVFTILTSLGFYFFGGWIGRIIDHIILLFLMKQIIKQVSGIDMMVVYFIWIVMLGVIQGVLLILISLLSLNQIATFLIAQTLTAIATFGVCKMFKWYRVFHTIRANLSLKLILFVTFFIFLIFASIYNFNLINVAFSATAVVLVAVIIYPIFLQVYQRHAGIISIENIKNDLFITAIEMVEENDPEKKYQIYALLAKQYGIDVVSFPDKKKKAVEEEAYSDAMSERVKELIQKKSLTSKKEIEIVLNVTYFEEYEGVGSTCTLEWFNMLLDYIWLDATDDNPVYVYLSSVNNTFELNVSGECITKDWQAVQEIFEQKSEPHHEELYDLYLKVTAMGGKVLARKYYIQKHKCHYLEISIELEKEGDIS